MKLIIIYGAPGVGKLTTARALSRLTGFKVFHNHLSSDVASSLFEFASAPWTRLVEHIRLSVFAAACEEGIDGLIHTFVYALPKDDAFVGRIVETIESAGGEVLFVRLRCDIATNEARVVSEDRKVTQKLKSVEKLRAALERSNLLEAIPFVESLDIDNSTGSAQETAATIANHFGLELVEREA